MHQMEHATRQRQNDEIVIVMLREVVQQIQDSLAQSISQSPPNESVTSHAVELEG